MKTKPYPLDEHADGVSDVIEFSNMVVRNGTYRLQDIVSGDSPSPLEHPKKAASGSKDARARLIADAMKIRSETREALGEELVNAMYRALMGSDPPDEEKS